jgi:GTP-binding protein
MSVAKRQGLGGFFRLVDQAARAHASVVGTADLNRIIDEAVSAYQPPVLGRGRLKLFYATQVGTRPPAMAIFTNRTAIPTHYKRYLERVFRERLELTGTPLRLYFKRRASH